MYESTIHVSELVDFLLTCGNSLQIILISSLSLSNDLNITTIKINCVTKLNKCGTLFSLR